MHFKTLCRLFNNAAKLIASVKERKSSQFDVDLSQHKAIVFPWKTINEINFVFSFSIPYPPLSPMPTHAHPSPIVPSLFPQPWFGF